MKILKEKVIAFMIKSRKQKGVKVIDNSNTDILGLYNCDAQLWSKNRKTLSDLSETCPVDFEIQKVDEEYCMQLYSTAKWVN